MSNPPHAMPATLGRGGKTTRSHAADEVERCVQIITDKIIRIIGIAT